MIRAANETDLPCLAEALVRLQEAHVRAFPDIYRPFNAGDATQHLAELLSRSDAIVRVVEHEGAVAGHVVMMIETKPESMFTCERRSGHIVQIEVAPEFRRQGYGRSLLKECARLAKAHDLPRLMLEVWAFNDSARAFFLATGYEKLGVKMTRVV
jgi:diamine N-acetyltransferase